jgi:nitrogen regulatory protein PII 2
MKEIITFIRSNMVNKTKEALAGAGYPAFLCISCLGRGKQALDPGVYKVVLETGDLPAGKEGESLSEGIRLVPKRFFSLVVEDDKVDLAVKTIIEANRTGNPGDGRVFVAPVNETYSVRTGEEGL